MIYRLSKSSLYFLFFSSVFIFIVLIILFFNDKFDIHTYLNQFHSVFFDYFFSIITHFGDGLFSVFCFLFFFIVNKRIALIILITFILSSLITQGLKNFVFDDCMRPYYYIENGKLNVPLVEGVKMHSRHSFPSGHTTSVFALFTLFSLFLEKRRYAVVLFLSCFLISFSRIYLSQHFLGDILAGSLVGIFSALFIYIMLYDKLIRFNKSIKFGS